MAANAGLDDSTSALLRTRVHSDARRDFMRAELRRLAAGAEQHREEAARKERECEAMAASVEALRGKRDELTRRLADLTVGYTTCTDTVHDLALAAGRRRDILPAFHAAVGGREAAIVDSTRDEHVWSDCVHEESRVHGLALAHLNARLSRTRSAVDDHIAHVLSDAFLAQGVDDAEAHLEALAAAHKEKKDARMRAHIETEKAGLHVALSDARIAERDALLYRQQQAVAAMDATAEATWQTTDGAAVITAARQAMEEQSVRRIQAAAATTARKEEVASVRTAAAAAESAKQAQIDALQAQLREGSFGALRAQHEAGKARLRDVETQLVAAVVEATQLGQMHGELAAVKQQKFKACEEKEHQRDLIVAEMAGREEAVRAARERDAAAARDIVREIVALELTTLCDEEGNTRTVVEGDQRRAWQALSDKHTAAQRAPMRSMPRSSRPRRDADAQPMSGAKRPRTPSAHAEPPRGASERAPHTPQKRLHPHAVYEDAPTAGRRTPGGTSKSKSRGASGSKEPSQPRKRMLSNPRRSAGGKLFARDPNENRASMRKADDIQALFMDVAPEASAPSDISSLFQDQHVPPSTAGGSSRTTRSHMWGADLFQQGL